jgi:hypothetical protein
MTTQDVVEAAEDVIGRFAVRMESEIDLDSQHPHAKHEQEAHFDVLFVQNRAAKGDGMAGRLLDWLDKKYG